MRYIITAVLCLVFVISNTAFAMKNNYQVDYCKDNLVQGPSLSDAVLNIELHADGTDLALISVKTNVEGKFSIDSRYGPKLIVHVLSVEGSANNIRCTGTSKLNQKKIWLNCFKLKQ